MLYLGDRQQNACFHNGILVYSTASSCAQIYSSLVEKSFIGCFSTRFVIVALPKNEKWRPGGKTKWHDKCESQIAPPSFYQ